MTCVLMHETRREYIHVGSSPASLLVKHQPPIHAPSILCHVHAAYTHKKRSLFNSSEVEPYVK